MMTKPLSEWLKTTFGIELNYIVAMAKRKSFRFKVNGVLIKKVSYPLKSGDEVEISGKRFTVNFKGETNDDK